MDALDKSVVLLMILLSGFLSGSISYSLSKDEINKLSNDDGNVKYECKLEVK